MKKVCLLLFYLILFSIHTKAQLFSENFDEADNATTGMASGVSWTTSTVGCNIIAGDFFSVQNNQFQISDTDCTPTASWTTGNIDVSGQSCVAISLDVTDLAGVNYESTDIIELIVRVDGGGDQTLAVLEGDDLELMGGSTTMSNTVNLSSNTDLVIEIRANISAADESIAFDNVQVTTSTDCCPVSSGAMTILGAINPCGADGANEYVVIRNGNNAVDIDNCLLLGAAEGLKNTISVPYNYNYTWNGTSGTGTVGTRPVDASQPCGVGLNCYRFLDNDIVADQNNITALIADLNDNIAGCNPFADPGDAVPAGAMFVVFLGAGDGNGFDNDEGNFNFDYLCSFNEPVYLVFGTGTSFGYFENTSAGAERTYRVSVNGEDTNNLDYAVDVDGTADQMAYVISPDASAADYVTGLNCTANTPLPVELTAFYAEKQEQSIMLFWATETETNNAYFEIERSADAASFYSIGRKKGAGTSIEPNFYQFEDKTPKLGTNYYRLKQVDTDGTVHYSEKLAVVVDTKEVIIKLYPSPTDAVLTIQTSTEMQQLQVLDSRGILQFQTTNPLQQLDVRHLPTGIYFLRITTARGSFVKQFLKK